MDSIDSNIQRIRAAAAVLGYDADAREAIHDRVVGAEVSEADFFLAWQAARLLDADFTVSSP